MGKTLRVKDNCCTEKAEFNEVKKLTAKIANKTLEELQHEGLFVFPDNLKETDDITDEQMILRSVDNNYWTSNVMGFIGYDDERIVIKSRFSNGDNDFFLQYMLEKVLDFPNIVDLETDTNQKNKLFHWLIFLFPYYLQRALRKGPFKTYVRNEYNDSNIKGVINIARHITKNTPFVGKVAYDQREFAYDNHLMELVRHTIEFIKGKPYGREILARAKTEVKTVVECTPSYCFGDKNKVIAKNSKNTVRHAYYREYSALQRLCLLILKNRKHQIGSGERKIYGILFDGAWLWEEYVNAIIGSAFHHPMNKGGSGAQRLFNRDADSKRNVGLIYPDFISKNKDKRIIADAKYKPIDNIGNRDYLQVLAYMFRFDAKNGYYIYPMKVDATDEKSFKNSDAANDIDTFYLNQGSTYEADVKKREDIYVVKYGIRIPGKHQTQDYNCFKAEIQGAEKRLKEDLLTEINKQKVIKED